MCEMLKSRNVCQVKKRYTSILKDEGYCLGCNLQSIILMRGRWYGEFGPNRNSKLAYSECTISMQVQYTRITDQTPLTTPVVVVVCGGDGGLGLSTRLMHERRRLSRLVIRSYRVSVSHRRGRSWRYRGCHTVHGCRRQVLEGLGTRWSQVLATHGTLGKARPATYCPG